MPLQVPTPSNLEAEQPLPDRRLIRAARSLYSNRQRLSTIEARIDRATEDLTAYLGLFGLSTAQICAYAVAWDGESVTLERMPSVDAAQLELPELDEASRGEQLNETVLARAAEGRLPCPWCDTPLAAQNIEIEGEPEVRLYCPAETCGFEEY